MIYLKALAIALPQILKIFNFVVDQLKLGVREIHIKSKLRDIDDAVKIKNPADRARAANDVFRK